MTKLLTFILATTVIATLALVLSVTGNVSTSDHIAGIKRIG